MILRAFFLAVGQIGDRRFRRVLGLGILLTFVLLVAAYAAFLWFITSVFGTEITLPVLGEVLWLNDLLSWSSLILMMVLSVFLHMARVFYHGAYKPPREFNWVIGVILLTLTLLLSFTGYLLPWDQLALWAVTVGTNMMGYTPVFGNQVRFALLGMVGVLSLLLQHQMVSLASTADDMEFESSGER